MDAMLLIGHGYIGSAIEKHLVSIGRAVDTVDWKENIDYDELTRADIRRYRTIVLTAGHSSVPQCLNDPYGAWENNVSKFVRLLEKVQDQTLIYASTGAVYSGCADTTERNTVFAPLNTLDLTKFTIDQVAKLSGKACYGLRFGTVAGWSPIARNDLMINRMYANRHTGKVFMANPDIKRAILGVSDLARAVCAISDNPINPGIYNLASFSKTCRAICESVAAELGLDVVLQPPTPAYDFSLDTTKFAEMYDFEFRATIPSIVRSFDAQTV